MDIQVGDKITYKNLDGDIITALIYDSGDLKRMEKALKSTELIKIERPKYEIVEEKKELLTEEEKEFLKQYIKIIENLNNGKFKELLRQEERMLIFLDTGITYYIEVGKKFGNMKVDKTYTLKELGLEGN